MEVAVGPAPCIPKRGECAWEGGGGERDSEGCTQPSNSRRGTRDCIRVRARQMVWDEHHLGVVAVSNRVQINHGHGVTRAHQARVPVAAEVPELIRARGGGALAYRGVRGGQPKMQVMVCVGWGGDRVGWG